MCNHLNYCQAAFAIENARLHERNHYLNTIRILAAAIESKDIYTRGHSLRVAGYPTAVARKINLPEEKVEGIYTAGVLSNRLIFLRT